MIWVVIVSALVKSSLVAGSALLAARLLGRMPADRVDILRGAICLLLALPVLGALLPDLDLRLLPAVQPTFQPVVTLWEGEIGPVAGVAVSGALPWPDAADLGLWALGLWLLGMLALGARLGLGLFTLDRWTRQGRAVSSRDWLSELRRLSPSRSPQLVASDRIAGPLSWGIAPGVVLVDPVSLAEPDAAPAILAHELAHLRRHDWLFLILSRMAVAVFWFNPLVWRLHAELVARSEEAADAAALRSVDRRLYARALVRLAASPCNVPGAAVAMAADARTLKQRIACIMSDAPARRRPLTVALSIAALAVVATPLAALEISRHDWIAPPAPPAPPQAPLSAVPPAPPVAPVPPAPPAPPQIRSGSVVIIGEDTPESRAAAAEADREAREAHRHAEAAHREAMVAHRQAMQSARDAGLAAAHALRDHEVGLTRVRIDADAARRAGEDARRAGAEARREGERARVEGERAMARARIDMARGAEDMRRGARQLREEAVRLRDPAYRAEQIEKNRARGQVVTDQHLIELSRTLPGKADEMDRAADSMTRKDA